MSEPAGPITTAVALRGALEAAAGALDPAPSVEVASERLTWSAAGRPIVVLAGAGASFRVGLEIGAPARRTADAGESALGPEWVEFRPPTLDDHAIDRVVAWFAAAHRRAGHRD